VQLSKGTEAQYGERRAACINTVLTIIKLKSEVINKQIKLKCRLKDIKNYLLV
jgi:hypothetical protein